MPGRKYILYLTLLCLIEAVTVICFKGRIVSYSLIFLMVLAYSIFLYRFIYCRMIIFRYLKDNFPSLYKKHTIVILNFVLIGRYALTDKDVINSLDSKSFKYFKEQQILQRFFLLVFIVFTVLSVMLAIKK